MEYIDKIIMKIFYCFFLSTLLSLNNAFSQDSSGHVFYLNKPPTEGILLEEGWKFQVGDNPDYAVPEYDDKTWQYINPTLDIRELLPQIPRSGIIWFRLHFLVDSTVNNLLTLMMQQSGASEIYLNGKLIHSFGVLSSEPEKVKAFNPHEKPISFPISNTPQQVLAVRYALQPNIFYSTHFGNKNKGLYIKVNTVENAFSQYEQTHTNNAKKGGFWAGVFIILGILYLAFYLFYPFQKAHLYFSLYAFLTAGFWSYSIYADNINAVGIWFPLNNLMLALGVVTNLILLMAIYRLLEQKIGAVYYCLIALGIISIAFGAFIYGWGWLIFGLLFSNSTIIDATRIAFKAARKNNKGAWIIAAGGISFFVCWIIYELQSFGFLSDYVDFLSLAIFCIPVAVAIALGYDFALTNRSLKQKLTEIENLSKEKLEIEKKSQVAQIEAMVATQEEERKRISRDLHDDVGTKLSALKLFVSSLHRKAKRSNDEEIQSLAKSSEQFITEVMQDVRSLLLNLSPALLEEFGYTTAVEALVNKINETKEIHFSLVVFGMKERLQKEHELALYRITQELVNNVLKHADAKQVSLQIGYRDEQIVLMIEDDGKGFDVHTHKDGYGLHNLEARTKLLHGVMSIDSQPRKGTSVVVEVPYKFKEA